MSAWAAQWRLASQLLPVRACRSGSRWADWHTPTLLWVNAMVAILSWVEYLVVRSGNRTFGWVATMCVRFMMNALHFIVVFTCRQHRIF